MTIDHNDPRLTAYVLDELDPAERLELERELAESAELRAEIDSLRHTAMFVSGELGGAFAKARAFQPLPAREERHAVAALSSEPVSAASMSGNMTRRKRPSLRRPLAVLAIAASVMIVSGLLWMPSLRKSALAPSLASHTPRTIGVGQTRQPRDLGVAGAVVVEQNAASAGPAAAQIQGIVPEPTAGQSQRGRQSGERAGYEIVTTEAAPAPTQPATPLYVVGKEVYETPPAAIVKGDAAAAMPNVVPQRPESLQKLAELGPVQLGVRFSAEQQTLTRRAGVTREWYYADESRRLQEGIDRFGWEPRRPGANPYDVPVEHNTEAYARINDNPFQAVAQHPLSTFSIDVDTASYANVRRFLKQGALPPADAVRIEELVNYFDYDYDGPSDATPFAVHNEIVACPWKPEHRLLRVALKGRTIEAGQRPASNLVFLLDVSGSMNDPNKLPLVKQAMRMLVEKLTENDRVAIVVYAGASGLVLPSTTANNKETILSAIENLQPGGSTNGASGIELAYDTAVANLLKEGTNRVILCTDGDFNVGVTNEGDLTRLIEEKAKSGVFLSVLGFGMGNYKDSTLEKLADKGNGNYGYIDTAGEARKLFVEQIEGTLVTIAKDVKIQIEFNPARVASYRLLGYENRVLAAEDFNDDKKDAGEIGAGHVVTALYELVPAGQSTGAESVDPLKYQPQQAVAEAPNASDETLTLKLRYKEPTASESKLLEFPLQDKGAEFSEASKDTQFAASVALFGMLLRGSEHKGAGSYDAALEIAQSAKGADEHGYRAEFIELVRKAKELTTK